MHTVTSLDGTTIAYDRYGDGDAPVVILVNGALGDRRLDRRFKLMGALAEQLAPSYTAINYDRRGRGDSTEAGPFSVQREIEDIAALIADNGGRASLFGFSSGGALALRAAGAGIGVERVASYEAPFMVDPNDRRPPADYGRRIDELIAAGDKSGAVKLFHRGAIGMPAPIVAAMRLMPMWKELEANAHTLRYDWEALGEHNMQGEPLRPDEWSSVTVPALVLYGAKSPSNLQHGSQALAEVLPNAQLAELAGISHRLKVDVVAPVLADFLAGQAVGADGGQMRASAAA
jgi:pimeloyl-ACP methyl ester carboxylesterase